MEALPDRRHPSENAPNQLLVEGPDDLHAVAHLMDLHDFPMDSSNPCAPFIKVCGGYTGVVESILVPVKVSRYKRIGIIVDANNQPADRWAQLRDQLGRVSKEMGVAVRLPESPVSQGTIVDGFFPDTRIGVWLMPNNQDSGALEDFLETLVPDDNACWLYAKSATIEARNHGALYSDAGFKKARLHAWLAWQEEPGLPFGTALKSCYLKSDSPLALTFVEWFKRLFV
jgi:hypothetical protein